MTQPLPGAPAIDYTSRDFASIRDDLLNLIPVFMPEWTSRSPNDFGIVLAELWAYVADQLHYYADRQANEAYIDTATQRANVIRLARMLGYTPANSIAAQVTLTFTNSTGGSLVVPALTQVATTANAATGSPVVFETDSALTVAANSTATVNAHQGTTISNEQIGVSDGSVDQSYTLFNTSVIQGSLTVTVTAGGTAQTWTYVPRLTTASPFDQVYTTTVDQNGVVSVLFGDGVNGQVPTTGASITATYRIGGGVVGNVAAGTLTSILTNVPAGISVTNNAAATGGADAESTASIRANASNAITTAGRAVTLTDYANLAVQVPGCAKASATSTVYTNVTVYVAPSGGQGYDGTGGTTGSPTATLNSLISTVGAYLNKVKPAPTTVTVQGPTYVPVNISVTIHLSPQTSQTVAVSAATAALDALLGFDNVIFNDQITPNDVYLALSSVPGVIYNDLSILSRTGSGVGVVSMAVNEIPIVGTISVTASGGTP